SAALNKRSGKRRPARVATSLATPHAQSAVRSGRRPQRDAPAHDRAAAAGTELEGDLAPERLRALRHVGEAATAGPFGPHHPDTVVDDGRDQLTAGHNRHRYVDPTRAGVA